MLLFCGAPSFQAELAATFHSLVEDPHALVRRTIACGFHEVGRIDFSDNIIIWMLRWMVRIFFHGKTGKKVNAWETPN